MSQPDQPKRAPNPTRFGLGIVAVMWLAGAVLGLVWQWWSPPGPAGYVIGPGQVQPDETEAFVAADGRYALIVLASGVLAALVVWFSGRLRGIPAVLALTVGGLGGALCTQIVGWGVRGDGRHYVCGAGGTCIAHLRLTLHMHGLLLVEAAAAVLVYGLIVSFAASDDLGTPDPTRELARGSAGPDVELQHAGGHGDGSGGPQQGEFPP